MVRIVPRSAAIGAGLAVLLVLQAGVFPSRARGEIACVIEAGTGGLNDATQMADLPGGGLLISAGAESAGALISAGPRLFRYDPLAGRVVPAGGAETATVRVISPVSGGGVLIGAERGLFRHDPGSGSVVPVSGGATAGGRMGGVVAIHPLRGGGALIAAELGWFRYDAAGTQAMPAGEPTRLVHSLSIYHRLFHDLPGGGVLIRDDGNWFRYDPASGRVTAAGNVATDDVSRTLDLPGGGVLIGTHAGLFRYDPAARRVVPAGGPATGLVGEMQALPDGGALVRARLGLFRYDPVTGRAVPVGLPAAGNYVLHGLDGGGLLLGGELGWFRYDPAVGRVVRAGDPGGGIAGEMHDLPGGGVLIPAGAGPLRRYDPLTGRVVRVDGADVMLVRNLHRLPGGDVLFRNYDPFRQRYLGWFRYDAATGGVVPAGDAGAEGLLHGMHALPGGGVLIRSERSWFRYDPRERRVVEAHSLATGRVLGTGALPGGGVLIWAERGWFRYDPAAGRMVPAGGREADSLPSLDAARRWMESDLPMRNLPGGGVLFRTERGWYRGPEARLAQATVTPATQRGLDRERPSGDRVSVAVTMRHACAEVATNLGLSLVARGPAGPEQVVPARLAHGTAPGREATQLTGEFTFDRAGPWTLALRQGAAPVGEPLRFTVAAPGVWERLRAVWPWVAGGVTAAYALAFTALLLGAHRSARAFRVLTDAAWAKWLTWPFFLLRHLPAVQRWVLESWFQEARRAVRPEAAFLDPPAAPADGAGVPASSLLPMLRDAPRLWLQGRSGMGKSSVFAAWERAYFAAPDAPTLAASARRFGFILVTIPVRHHAALTPPEANRPESWIIEALRRRFEMFGMGELDPALVRAMLRSGHIALALDGLNEADAEGALTAFARQFPQVRLLVTSQTRGGEGWRVWQLPPDVAGMREGLLSLWLGREKAAALDRRLVAEGLSEEILSGYDLRLVADLAGADPGRAALPRDRIALYRAMLARARDAAGEPLPLGPVARLAWTMVTERRREITAEDARALGGGTLKGLTREGVRILRQAGPLHEFRHDQMRAFLAALWLVEELPGAAAVQATLLKAEAFALARRDQGEVWRFLAAMLRTEEDLKDLWRFANEEPQARGLLLAALQEEADRRDVTLVRPSRRRRRETA